MSPVERHKILSAALLHARTIVVSETSGEPAIHRARASDTMEAMPGSADTNSEETEVLVVGAGPTGLTLASELRRRGVGCRVIDRSAGRASGSRAVDLQPRTLDIFHRMGLVDAALARGRRISGLSIFDGGRPLAELRYSAEEAAFPFVLGLPQSETERILEAHFESLGGRVERQTQLVSLDARDDGASATLRRRRREGKIGARWVVGCDGVSSSVRELLGVGVESRGQSETVVTIDAEILWALPPDRVTLFLSDLGYVLVLPMGRERRSRLIIDVEKADFGVELEEIEAAIAERVGAPIRLQDATTPQRWRVKRQLARGFQAGRVFLAGDAAHAHSPVGGHGLNQGIQDAYNLAWKLALVVHGDASPDLLESYGAERRGVASGFLDEIDFEARVSLFRSGTDPGSRDRLMRYAGRCDPLRRGVLDAAVQGAMSYARSPIVQFAGGAESRNMPLLGQPAPHAPLVGLRHSTLAERTRGEGFVVLLFSGLDADGDARARVERAMAALSKEEGHHLRTFVVVGNEPASADLADALIPDPTGDLHRLYRVTGDAAFVIRPDGYVGFCSRPADALAIRAHLTSFLSDSLPTRPAPALT